MSDGREPVADVASTGDAFSPELFTGSDTSDDAPPRQPPTTYARGTTIARYLVLEVLGEGAMGAVYAAYDPELDRRVAVKLLRTVGSSESAKKRLVREARALAKLSHPNVVQVHDAGVHEGDVFIAMELVEGTSLKEWVNETGTEPVRGHREVLQAYVDAARGLAAAHAQGLVHRDIKPANLLMGKDGRARVADFGLAAAQGRGPDAADLRPDSQSGPSLAGDSQPVSSSLQGRLDEYLTRTGVVMGTPAYMAPEQHASADVGPAADQYSLCVSLYQGLYGSLPFAFEKSPDALSQIIERKRRGEILPPPAGSPVPAWVYRALLRGLAARPEERYPSLAELIAALSEDPDARRRARRRTAASLALTLGLLGAAIAGWARSGAFRDPCAHQEQQLAGAWDEGVKARVRAAFLGTGRSYAEDTVARVVARIERYAGDWAAMRTEVCEAHRESKQPRDVLTLRDVCLDRRRGQLQALTTLFAERPDAEVLDKAVTAAAGLYPIAYCADTEALTAPVRPPEDPALRARVEAVQPRVDRLEALYTAGKFKEGLALGEPLLGEVEAIAYPPLRAEAQYWVGRLRDETGDYDGAKASLHDAIDTAAEGKDDVLVANAWAWMLYVVSDRQRRFEEAETLRTWGRPAVSRAHDERAQAFWLNAQAILLWRRGKLAEAKAIHERVVALREKLLGPDHPDIAVSLNNLALVLVDMGDYRQAKAIHERVVALREKALGPDHPRVAASLSNLALVLQRMGDYPQAKAILERASGLLEKALGPDHPSVAQSLNNLGDVLCAMGDYAEARATLERALAIKEKALGPDHPGIATSLNNLGLVLYAMGDDPQAKAVHERALAIEEKVQGPDHPDVAESLNNLGLVLSDMGAYAQAKANHERALTIQEKALGPDHPDIAAGLTGLGRALVGLRQLDAALPPLQRALAVREKALGASHPDLAATLLGLAELHLARRHPAESVPLLERALGLDDKAVRPEIQLALADALWPLRRDRPRALALAREARADYERRGHRPGLTKTDAWLAERPDGAAASVAAAARPAR